MPKIESHEMDVDVDLNLQIKRQIIEFYYWHSKISGWMMRSTAICKEMMNLKIRIRIERLLRIKMGL